MIALQLVKFIRLIANALVAANRSRIGLVSETLTVILSLEIVSVWSSPLLP